MIRGMTPDDRRLLDDLVVGVLPSVTPYQFALYAYLLRSAGTSGEAHVIKVGKRTIAAGLGKGTRSSQGNLQHITEKLQELHDLGLIRLGEADRLGTSIAVISPDQVPWVVEALGRPAELAVALDYFRDPELRLELFARDRWRCRYCGVTVDDLTATLDHVVPQSGGGTDDPANLATACHACNSVKSGKTEAEATPLLLARLRNNELRRP